MYASARSSSVAETLIRVVIAENTYMTATPINIVDSGDIFLFITEKKIITNAGISANTKAFTTMADSPYSPGITEIPRIIAKDDPSPAPDDIPVVYGSARGFFSELCMTAPQIARPAPTNSPPRTRGNLRSQITWSFINPISSVAMLPVMWSQRI